MPQDESTLAAESVAVSLRSTASGLSRAATDEALVSLWLQSQRSAGTQDQYQRDLRRFRSVIALPLRQVTLDDLLLYQASLAEMGLADATQQRVMASLKSLLGFGHRIGYLPFNVGVALRTHQPKNKRAERILPEPLVHQLLSYENDPRNRLILRLIYTAGLRASEVCSLCWQDLQARENGQGQVTVYGKGEETRFILLPMQLWHELQAFRPDSATDNCPVFLSKRSQGPIERTAVHRLVKKAVAKAGLPADVSTHWLRHAHASHALDRGAPVSLVQKTLGHSSIATTSKYLHARPGDSSALYLGL